MIGLSAHGLIQTDGRWDATEAPITHGDSASRGGNGVVGGGVHGDSPIGSEPRFGAFIARTLHEATSELLRPRSRQDLNLRPQD